MVDAHQTFYLMLRDINLELDKLQKSEFVEKAIAKVNKLIQFMNDVHVSVHE